MRRLWLHSCEIFTKITPCLDAELAAHNDSMAFNMSMGAFSSLDSVEMRQAGRDWLSLALMDARNQTLSLISHYEQALGERNFQVPRVAELNPPLWELGHVGWFQERWIGRNLQRHQGLRCDPEAATLPSQLPWADQWWDSSRIAHDTRWQLDLPGLSEIKAYLLSTLESTLDLLAKTPDEDDALYFYRLAVFPEDMHGEAFLYMAQTLGLPLRLSPSLPAVVREP